MTMGEKISAFNKLIKTCVYNLHRLLAVCITTCRKFALNTKKKKRLCNRLIDMETYKLYTRSIQILSDPVFVKKEEFSET